MQLFRNPPKDQWPLLLQRPMMDATAMEDRIRPIIEKIKEEGDTALLRYTEQFDGVKDAGIVVEKEIIDAAAEQLPEELKAAMQLAAANLRRFHQQQTLTEEPIETMPGVKCWRRTVAIEKVGLYIPGGTAPLFSTVLMLGIPAVIAGCHEIVLCTPPSMEHQSTGYVHAGILYAASLAGITRVFRAGGAQAIAAMAYGTASVPAVYKIFGPGNQYVTAAKQFVQRDGIAIDMPAGPSEVAVYADETASPAFVAADLLSQAEHGADSQVLLLTTQQSFASAVEQELKIQLDLLPRRAFAEKALQNSKCIIVNTESDAIQILDEYAAEHLILSCSNARRVAERVKNAGSVFIGHYSPESVGDYASGTNHTLPTNGYARAYSGVSVDSFVKKITYQELTADGLRAIGPAVELMAAAEGLQGHKNAVSLRLQQMDHADSN